MIRSALATVFLLSALLVGCPHGGGCSSTPFNEPRVRVEVVAPGDVDPQICSTGVNAMAFNLWRAIDDLPSNAAISPTSIAFSMNMLLAGARGSTADEMADALGVAPGDELHRCWASMLTRWEEAAKAKDLELRVVNRLFGQEDLPFEDPYIQLTGRLYRAPLTQLDFRDQPDVSRRAINRWVERSTQGHIKDLLPDGSIHERTSLVLANAIYFLAEWEKEFDRSDTRPAPFHRADGSSAQAQMMRQTNGFRYAQDEGLQLLEMPYSSGDISMVVLLPDTHDGLPALEERIDPSLFASWMEELRPRQVSLFLPRFTIKETSVALIPAFQSLGVTQLFTRPDLTGIVHGESRIDGIFHKTFVEVDEAGTEAAAATAEVALVERVSVQTQIVEFRADRPFLFLIVDQQTGMILFMGRVNSP